MECLVIPGILIGIWLILTIILRLTVYENEWGSLDSFWMPTIIIGILFLVACIAMPIFYHTDGRACAVRASNYYDNIIVPNIIEEYDDYVVVSNIEASIWQAGENNLTGYNAYLASNRYWDSVPILGCQVYPAPERLKYVRVKSGE